MQQLSRNRFVSPTTAGTADFALRGSRFFAAHSARQSAWENGDCFCLCNTRAFLFLNILQGMKMKDAIFVPLIG